MTTGRLTDLCDKRLEERGNLLLRRLFSKSVHSVRQLAGNEAEAKGFYRFLNNSRVSEGDIEKNMISNCRSACEGKYILCIQDTTEINLRKHSGRIKVDGYLGKTNGKNDKDIGFFIHPGFVVDAMQGIPYGYTGVKIWNRDYDKSDTKEERQYQKLPFEDKESYKWVEVSNKAKTSIGDVVAHMLIVQDREGDIYEQFAQIPDAKTDLLIRCCNDRILCGKEKLFSCTENEPVQGYHEVTIAGKGGRKGRDAVIAIKYRRVEIRRPQDVSKVHPPSLSLYFIEAEEVDYCGADKVCWRILTSIPVESYEIARACVEWYSWRWLIEEVFKILKKEGYDIEASELESAASIRKMCLLIMETVIKLFLMRLAYAEPEIELPAESCFNEEEIPILEHQIKKMEGRTAKQQNPYGKNDLKRYVWVICRLGGWKGYESKRHPGITTLWMGIKQFKAIMEGYMLYKDLSTR